MRWLMCSTTAQVVRDEEVGQMESLLQVLQQVDDLRLDRNVERGDRLVEHQEARLDGERARDADALALAAGELVRIALERLGAHPDALEQLTIRSLFLARRARARESRFPRRRSRRTRMRGLSDA